jgi:hypothetical protein
MIHTVDVVAFWPKVTITEVGEVHGLTNLKRLDDPELFTEFLKDPRDFAQFFQNRQKETYSSVFAFHIQPVNPTFPCFVIHVYPAENGKENPQAVENLLTLKNKLEIEFEFAVLGLLLMAILVLTSSMRGSCGNGSRTF